MEKLFTKADLESVVEDEENQSYEMFVEIGSRKPNKNGTGRNKLSKNRNKILCLYFGSEETKPAYLSTFIKLLSSFFMLCLITRIISFDRLIL